jgi:hypothetical protein
MAAVEVKNILTLVPELLKAPYSWIWTSYDKEADVLYINFEKGEIAGIASALRGSDKEDYREGLCRKPDRSHKAGYFSV